MLAIQKSSSHRGECNPNILPCRINHNGPVDTSKRYWNPTRAADSKTTAYFRGRKLHGKKLKIPKGYKGVVVSRTDRILPRTTPDTKAREEEDEGDDLEDELEVKILEEEATFEDVMLWGHEALPDELVDPYVRGMEEWIAFAEKIHDYSGVEAEGKDTKEQKAG